MSKIAVFIKSLPFDNGACEEGLQMALGLATCMERHTVSTILAADAVWFALKTVNDGCYTRYAVGFKAMESEIFVEKESLDKRKIPLENLNDSYTVISRHEIEKKLDEADNILTY